ncbi:MAG: phasin family protein [Pseudomonadota bacterium]
MAASKKATKSKKPAASKAKRKTGAKKASSSTTKRAAAPKAKSANGQIPNMDKLFGMETLMTQSPFQFDKITQEASAMGQAQMEAAMKSSNTFMKGMEDMMKTYMEMMQDSTEKSAEAMKSVMACKTLNEYTEAQNKIAQASFDDFMAGATKLSEMSVKICTEACEPINDQLTKSMQKASKAMAA